MSKTKNSPKFQQMMDEQELAASFSYEEQEAEYIAMRNDLAREHAIRKAKHYFDLAGKDLALAHDKYIEAATDLLKLLEDDTDGQKL
jgi:hypothetical protein